MRFSIASLSGLLALVAAQQRAIIVHEKSAMVARGPNEPLMFQPLEEGNATVWDITHVNGPIATIYSAKDKLYASFERPPGSGSPIIGSPEPQQIEFRGGDQEVLLKSPGESLFFEVLRGHVFLWPFRDDSTQHFSVVEQPSE